MSEVTASGPRAAGVAITDALEPAIGHHTGVLAGGLLSEAAPADAAPADQAPSDAAPSDSALDAAGLAALLRPTVLRLSRRLRAEKADSELSDSQSMVLAYLAKHGPSTPGTLARFERVTPPSMNRTVNSVVAAGYALRSPASDDGRKVVVSLTEAGAALVIETRRRRDAWLYRRLAELTMDDRATLERASGILRAMADS